MELIDKVSILADAAKYDASCASSGSIQRDSRKSKGIGSTSSGMGICHSYAPDGRCISLLKILLTNFCIYDCSYCINRASSPVQRARFSVEEVVQLTLDFYKRNYIEGLFLSSGIIQSSDYTMEQLMLVAKQLRCEHQFAGYIHLKSIPDASPELLKTAGLYADRLSINVELPAKQSLARLAPEKNAQTIRHSMGTLKTYIDEAKEQKKQTKKVRASRNLRKKSASFNYAPAGQSTQMIVGADNSSDKRILTLSHQLYDSYRMRRVYYSAYSPIPDPAKILPAVSPPLMREHRLYQADWLLRFYSFNVNEIIESKSEAENMLALDIDPKLAWALRHREFFPVNINKASLDELLRVPGIGTISAKRILRSRKTRALRYDDIAKLRLSVKKVSPFIECFGGNPDHKRLDDTALRQQLSDKSAQQLSLF